MEVIFNGRFSATLTPTTNMRAPKKLGNILRFLRKSGVVPLQYDRESNPCHATHGCSHELLFSLRKLPPFPVLGQSLPAASSFGVAYLIKMLLRRVLLFLSSLPLIRLV